MAHRRTRKNKIHMFCAMKSCHCDYTSPHILIHNGYLEDEEFVHVIIHLSNTVY